MDGGNLRPAAPSAREELRGMLVASERATRKVYPGFIASLIRRYLLSAPEDDVRVDLMQSNGMYAAHQLRVRLSGDDTIYRVIVAPANAPISVGGVPVDQHFALPLEG